MLVEKTSKIRLSLLGPILKNNKIIHPTPVEMGDFLLIKLKLFEFLLKDINKIPDLFIILKSIEIFYRTQLYTIYILYFFLFFVKKVETM